MPDEAPPGRHEDRARDQHVTHLRRLLAAEDPAAAHRVVADLLPRLVESHIDPAERVLDDRTQAFLRHPPLGSARYRRELDAVLGRIETR